MSKRVNFWSQCVSVSWMCNTYKELTYIIMDLLKSVQLLYDHVFVLSLFISLCKKQGKFTKGQTFLLWKLKAKVVITKCQLLNDHIFVLQDKNKKEKNGEYTRCHF